MFVPEFQRFVLDTERPETAQSSSLDVLFLGSPQFPWAAPSQLPRRTNHANFRCKRPDHVFRVLSIASLLLDS